MITITVENVYCQINGLDDQKIIDEIDNKLSYYVQGYQYIRSYQMRQWDGKQHMFKNMKLQTGLLSLLEDILKSNNAAYNIIDNRKDPILGKKIKIKSDYCIPRDYQEQIVEACLREKCGLVKAATGCHSRGQGILMYDGSIKMVEDIFIGDQLMGPDSMPRNVLQLCRGIDDMVEVVPVKGKSFIVNKEHILSLQRTKKRSVDKRSGSIIDISVNNWQKWHKTDKHIHKLFRTGVVFNTELNDYKLPLESYFLGLLLGDGSIKTAIGITTADKEIVDYIYEQAALFELKIRMAEQENNASSTYFLTKIINKCYIPHPIILILKQLNLYGTSCGDKFIPLIYLTSSYNNRLELLAGLIDTDGSLSRNGYDFISKSKQLSNDIAYLARSLGLAAYINECYKHDQNGNGGLYYRVSISGDTDMVPCRIKRKIAPKRRQKKSVLRTGFAIKELGYKDAFFGFTLNGDGRYLLDDFTVTHNSGKTLCLSMLIAQTNIKTVIYVITLDLLYQTHQAIQEALGIPIGIVGDGLCDIRKITIATPWTISHAFDSDYVSADEDDNNGRNEKLDNTSKSKIRKMVKDAKMFIIDEVQYLSCASFQLVAKKSIDARYRFGFSGTIHRDDGATIALFASTGKKLIDIDATTLINRGVLVPPKIFFFEVPTLEGFDMDDKKPYAQVYDQYIVENETRNSMIIESAEKLFAKGRKILILVRRKKHGLKLLEMMPKTIRTYYLDGSADSDERRAVKDLFNINGVDIIIASVVFDAGINIPSLNCLILAGGGRSTVRSIQRIGRVIRGFPGKKDAIVVDWIDHAPYLYEHSRKRFHTYQTEPGFKIKLPQNIDWR